MNTPDFTVNKSTEAWTESTGLRVEHSTQGATVGGAVTDQRPPHLDDGVAELQGVEELDEGGHLDPVLPVEAVPLLAGHLQLGGQ